MHEAKFQDGIINCKIGLTIDIPQFTLLQRTGKRKKAI